MTADGGRPSRRWSGKRAFGETALANAGVLVLGTVTGIFTARLLGPDGRGIYSLAVAVSALAAIVLGLGLQQALAFTVAGNPGRAGEALFLASAVALVGGIAGLVVGVPLTRVLVPDSETANAICIGLVSLPLSLFAGNVTGIFQGLRLGRPFNALRLVTPFAFAVLLVMAAVVFGLSAEEVVLLWVISQVAAVLLALRLLRRDRIRLGRATRAFIRSTIRYGLVVNVDSLAWQANRYAGLLVLGVTGTLTQVGLFSVGLGYSAPVAVIAIAIALHTLPDISAAAVTDQAALAASRIRSAAMTTVPLAAAAILVAPFLLPLAFGSDFERAVGAAQILVVAQAVIGMGQVLGEISRGLGRPGLSAVASLTGALGAMAAIPLLLPPYGIEGVAVGTVVAYALMLGILAIGLRQYLSDGGSAGPSPAPEGPTEP
jgi:O-antigen/teichoic acid export membrane protein